MTRTIILHYHLFKNAGTSLDLILKRNFGTRWVTAEFPTAGQTNTGSTNTAAVADWIRANPEAVAFSSHTAQGPIPQIDGVKVISVLFLRDPIARIRSAYAFARQQGAETWGAELAASTDFAGYVRARLARPGDRQCRNFQTHRLALLAPPLAPGPEPEPELDRALRGLVMLSFVGLVAEFDRSVARLARLVQPDFAAFHWTPVRANSTARQPESGPDAAADQNPAAVIQTLQAANRDDQHLLDHACALYGAQAGV